MPQSLRLRYMRYSPVFMKLKLRIGQRNTSVFAPIVRRLWKHFRLPKRLLWCDTASRRWMVSLPGMPWGYTGSLAMPECEEMKSLTSSQGAVLVSGLLGLSLFWGVSRQNIRRKMKRWMQRQHLALWHSPCGTQRQAGELISGPNLATGARLLSFNRTHPGLLSFCSPEITPSEDTSI